MIHQTLFIAHRTAYFSSERHIVNQQGEIKYKYKRSLLGANYQLLNDKNEPIYDFIHKWGFSTPYDMYDRSETKLLRFRTVFGYAFMGKDYVEIISENQDTYQMFGKPHRLIFKVLKNEELLINIHDACDESFKRQIDLYTEEDEAFVLGLMVGAIATFETANTSMDQ